MRRCPMTVLGKEAIEKELKHLKGTERKNIISAISEARLHGDLSENAEYSSAKEKQGFIEGRIRSIEAKLSIIEVIDPLMLSGDRVKFSATVTVIDEENNTENTYQIVGEDEADLEKGKLFFQSPLARAMINKSAGDSIKVITPRGSRDYEIVKVEFK